MRNGDIIALEHILQHKDYFDQKLISIVTSLDSEAASQRSLNKTLTGQNQGYRKQMSNLRFKIKDLESQKYTINKKYLDAKDENDEILEELKKIQKQIDELKKENEQHRIGIKQQEKVIKRQKDIIDKLKYMNSTNSNLPSSLNILTHTKPNSQTSERMETSSNKRGGQKHHSLHKSNVKESADHINIIKVKKVPTGAVPVKNKQGMIEYYVTQEVDLLLKSVIRETRYYLEETGNELEQRIMRKYAVNPLTYSSRFKASIVYLNQKGTIPLQRLCDMMREISEGSIQLQPGTISKWCQECDRKSQKEQEEILEDILGEPLIHVDETGAKINGEPYWIHVLTNGKGSIFRITKKRGDKEKGPVKILESYTGIVEHDHFSSYKALITCIHAECNAHIDRYLKSGIDFDKNEECREMLELLHEMLHRKHVLMGEGKTKMPDTERKAYEECYIEILERGLKNYKEKQPNIEKRYEAEYVKTFRRMLAYKDDHLRFITNFLVPYSNNNAEINCRQVKAKKNASGQFVSEMGGQAYTGILSLLQTAKIRKDNALGILEQIFH